jgi:ribonuclease P protein component
MLPFKNRLTKRKDFDRVQKSGQFFSEGNLALKFTQNDLGETRIGFVVGMKFSRKAVERNSAKRQLRELFRKKLSGLKKGVDVVVMIRKREGEKIFPNKLEKNADQILQKSSLL